MNENKLVDELSEKIHKTVEDFWEKYTDLDDVTFFIVNYSAMTELLSDMTYGLIKQDAPLEEYFDFIEKMGENVKNILILTREYYKE